MKTFIAAALVAFTVSTSAFAFEIPAVDGMPDGVQDMISKQGKQRGGAKQQSAQQSRQGGGEQQQQAGRGNMKDMMNSLMSGDISGIQGLAGSLGQ